MKLFNWFSRSKPEPIVIRDDTLQKVVDILFPKHIEKTEPEGTFIVDYSVDVNLVSALADLESGVNDHAVQDTIRKCISKLYEARDILYADDRITTTSATYLVVEAPPIKDAPETIKVGGH